MMTEYGEAIRVDGVRPDWLRDDELVIGRNDSWCPNETPMEARHYSWAAITNMLLPATHSYYQVARYNAEHGTSFVYWPGGDEAPRDWDGGDVLTDEVDGGCLYDGRNHDWRTRLSPKIIGYNQEAKAAPLEVIGKRLCFDPKTHVLVAKMSEAEALARWRYEEQGNPLPALRDLGLIRTPTRAETIAAKSGVAVDVVERVIAAMEEL